MANTASLSAGSTHACIACPFSGRLPMNRSDLPLYEYACHEGNYGMENLLRGARAQERAAAQQQ